MSAQARDEADAEKRLAEAELQSAIENRELARIELPARAASSWRCAR